MREISPHIAAHRRPDAAVVGCVRMPLSGAVVVATMTGVTVAPVLGALTVRQNRYPSLWGRFGMSPCQPPRLFSADIFGAVRVFPRRVSARAARHGQSLAEKNYAENKVFTEPKPCSLVDLARSHTMTGANYEGAGTCNYTNGFSPVWPPHRSPRVATPLGSKRFSAQVQGPVRPLPRAVTSLRVRFSGLRPTWPIAANTRRAADRAINTHTHGILPRDTSMTIGAFCAGGLFVANNAGGSRRPRT